MSETTSPAEVLRLSIETLTEAGFNIAKYHPPRLTQEGGVFTTVYAVRLPDAKVIRDFFLEKTGDTNFDTTPSAINHLARVYRDVFMANSA